MGVRGIALREGDEVVGMQLDTQGDSLLVVSENGMGKRTSMQEFRHQNRGGYGTKCYRVTDKTGPLMGVKAVSDDDEIMMITTEGVIIQIRMDELRDLGRITSGVRLIRLDEGAKVAQIAKVRMGEIPGEEEPSVSDEEDSGENQPEQDEDR